MGRETFTPNENLIYNICTMSWRFTKCRWPRRLTPGKSTRRPRWSTWCWRWVLEYGLVSLWSQFWAIESQWCLEIRRSLEEGCVPNIAWLLQPLIESDCIGFSGLGRRRSGCKRHIGKPVAPLFVGWCHAIVKLDLFLSLKMFLLLSFMISVWLGVAESSSWGFSSAFSSGQDHNG